MAAIASPSALLLVLMFIWNQFNVVAADWKYKSRPDLSPPTLNITVPETDEVSPGYLFVAPYTGWDKARIKPFGPLQPGPYIFTGKGDLVWSGFGYVGGYVANFQVGRWKGKDVLFAMECSCVEARYSPGHVKILDQHYRTIKDVRASNHRLLDLHEFAIKDETTALVAIYETIPADLKNYGAEPESQWIIDARVQGLFSSLSHHNSPVLIPI